MRPLYKSDFVPARRPEGAHRGLWFDKFCPDWTNDRNGTLSLGTNKLGWLKSLAGLCGERDMLESAVLRRIKLVESRGGRWGIFETDSRLVTGLGLSNPSESGFLWHPTLGVPYLPGSTIKGMVGASTTLGENVLGDKERVGSVAFMDAIPRLPAVTEVDVLTPHYAGWAENDPPGDWRSPIPVPFLTVAKGQSFLFSIVPLGSGSAEDQRGEVESVWKALSDALVEEGIGAKTAVGYGFFRMDESAAKKIREVRERELIRSDPGSPAAARADLRTKTEGQLLATVRRCADPEGPEDGCDASTLVSILDDRDFLEEWCSYWQGKGAKLECPEGTFLENWANKRKVDPGTVTGGKKLKAYAQALRQRASTP